MLQWTAIALVAGIPEGAYVNSVKEDTKVKGLLFAATELRVYVSFNDGDQWQPLQNNMPVVSIRDVLVHGDDLAIATHGRGFWVLDQMTPLREIAAHGAEITSANVWLFKPGETYSLHPGDMNGTPLPHEEPQELNPPGRPPSAAAGMHRFAIEPIAARGGFGRAATPRPPDACSGFTPPPATRPGRAAPLLTPGEYTLRLTVDGQTYTQPVTVKADPRQRQ
jgi:hypothetical protein